MYDWVTPSKLDRKDGFRARQFDWKYSTVCWVGKFGSIKNECRSRKNEEENGHIREVKAANWECS